MSGGKWQREKVKRKRRVSGTQFSLGGHGRPREKMTFALSPFSETTYRWLGEPWALRKVARPLRKQSTL